MAKPRCLFQGRLTSASAIKCLGLASLVWRTMPAGIWVTKGPGLLGIATRMGVRYAEGTAFAELFAGKDILGDSGDRRCLASSYSIEFRQEPWNRGSRIFVLIGERVGGSRARNGLSPGEVQGSVRTLEQQNPATWRGPARAGILSSNPGTGRHNETSFPAGVPARRRFGPEHRFGATRGSKERRLQCPRFRNTAGCF